MTTKLTEKERDKLFSIYEFSLSRHSEAQSTKDETIRHNVHASNLRRLGDHVESLLDKKTKEAKDMGYSIGFKYMNLLHETNKREFGRLIEELALEIKDNGI